MSDQRNERRWPAGPKQACHPNSLHSACRRTGSGSTSSGRSDRPCWSAPSGSSAPPTHRFAHFMKAFEVVGDGGADGGEPATAPLRVAPALVETTLWILPGKHVIRPVTVGHVGGPN